MQFKCLSIAGFDGSGGAGLQADLKTFTAFGCYGMTVLTALPIQNTCGVQRCYDLPLAAIQDQMAAIFEDIQPDAIKIGMLFSTNIIEVVADFLESHASDRQIVLDPVMIAKSGHSLLQNGSIATLKSRLIPLASLVTPNLPEAETLIPGKNHSRQTMARQILDLGAKAVLIKGGHEDGAFSRDYLLDDKGYEQWFSAPRIDSKNTHGTGCTLSAAITACLARGYSLQNACQMGKNYLQGAIKAAAFNSAGKGQGPVNHLYLLEDFIKSQLMMLEQSTMRSEKC